MSAPARLEAYKEGPVISFIPNTDSAEPSIAKLHVTQDVTDHPEREPKRENAA
jgi:hypothetical protein